MTQTRRVLLAANVQLNAQLAACNPESRKGLKAKLAAVRSENKQLQADKEALTARLTPLTPRLAA